MKKTFTLICSMIFLLVTNSFAWQNRLTISSNYKGSIKVLIDGRFYEPGKNNDEILISDQRPGNRNIKVYQQQNNERGRRGNRERDMELLYNGNLFIKDGFDVDVSINRFGKVFIDERVMDRNNGYENDEHDNRNNGNGNGKWNKQPMNERSFMQLKQTIGNESFDATRANILKTAVVENSLSSYQVKLLLGLFSFENSKLEMAKYCYRFVYDAPNYYMVADVFTFSNSKTELMKYIQLYR